nr:hypothetical protein [Solirubrobacter pauli]
MTVQAASTRATRSSGVSRSRSVANSGLNRPIATSSANWVARTSTRPAAPGMTNASGRQKHARSVPATSSAPRPDQRRESRAPTSPPAHGTPNATA